MVGVAVGGGGRFAVCSTVVGGSGRDLGATLWVLWVRLGFRWWERECRKFMDSGGLPRLVTKVAWISTTCVGLQVVLSSTPNSFKHIKSIMTEVQSQAPVIIDNIAQGSSTDKDALLSRLDELLEQYLHTLDEYQNAREQLSKQLSSVRSHNATSTMQR